MPLPRAIAKANRNGLNRITRRFAGVIPPLMLLRHAGRASGKPYETPLMAFRAGDRFVIALTYGPGTDWQRNLEAAGTAEALYGKRRYTLSAPRLAHGHPNDQPLPRIVRLALTILGVRDFLYVTAHREED